MNVNSEYTIRQIEYLCEYFYAYPKYEIHLARTRDTPPKITVYIDRLRIEYKDSKSIGLIFVRLLLLKEVLQ